LAGPDVLASRPRQRRADAAGPAGHLRSPGSARRPCPPGVTSHRADQPGRAVPGHIAASSCCASRQITDHVDKKATADHVALQISPGYPPGPVPL